MAWVRQLPPRKDGTRLWAATIRLPKGSKPSRLTESHRLKTVVKEWARDKEAEIQRGEFINPRLAETPVAACWAKFGSAKRKELASRKRDSSHWRCHVEPRWGDVPVGSITRPDISAWVVEMEEAKVGAPTIEGALKVLRGLLEMAIDAKMIKANPAARVSRPPAPVSTFRVISPREERLLLDRFGVLFGDRVDGALMVEVLLDTGMRWEECGGLRREAVDLKRRRIHVFGVLERDGSIREYAKTDAGNRWVPVSDHVWPKLRAAALRTPPGEPVFRGPTGARLDYSRWLSRIWNRGLRAAFIGPLLRRPGTRGPIARPTGPFLLDGAQPTPHDCRHTYGTRLADNGVHQHEIMALMGHKDQRASAVYIHAGEERFDRARKAIEAARRNTA